MWRVMFAEKWESWLHEIKNENQACKRQPNYLNVYRLQNIFLFLFPILRTFSLHSSDQQIILKCQKWSFHVFSASMHSSYAQILL